MKANVPRSYTSLPPAQRRQIEDHCRGVAYETAKEAIEKDMRIMFDLYIKMVCMILHDAFGFGEKRLYRFIGNHRQLFRRQVNMVRDNTQIEYLNRRMSEIFRKDGFPQQFFDNMLGEVGDNFSTCLTWHDAKTDLPFTSDTCIDYLVVISGATVPTLLCYDGSNWLDDDGNYYCVTHWMPLPELPIHLDR